VELIVAFLQVFFRHERNAGNGKFKERRRKARKQIMKKESKKGREFIINYFSRIADIICHQLCLAYIL